MSDVVGYKIILLGNHGVGKEILINKLSNNEHEENSITTIGVNIIRLYLNIDIDNNGTKENQKFEVSLIDTSGQGKFKSITIDYFYRTDGIFMIYDITNRGSFQNIEDWLETIRENFKPYSEKKIVIFLIGNKSNLIEEDNIKREVTENEAIKICEKYEIIWGGEQNLKDMDKTQLTEIFTVFVKEIYKKIGIKKYKKQRIDFNKAKEKRTNCICY